MCKEKKNVIVIPRALNITFNSLKSIVLKVFLKYFRYNESYLGLVSKKLANMYQKVLEIRF